MKKIFKILISLLLLISFLFMSIPISIRLLNPSFYDGPTLFRKTPTFEENPALFYDSFISSIQQPLLEKEEELLLLYYEAVDETEANKALKEMEISVSELSKTPKYLHESLQPLYDGNEEIKEALLLLIKSSYAKESSIPSLFNIVEMKPLYDDYLNKKDDLYQVTINTFKDLSIVFYLENDGTITVYNP